MSYAPHSLNCPLTTVQCQTGSYLPSLCFWCFLPPPLWWRQRQDLHPCPAPDTSAAVLDLAHLVCGIHYIIITSSLHHLSCSRKNPTVVKPVHSSHTASILQACICSMQSRNLRNLELLYRNSVYKQVTSVWQHLVICHKGGHYTYQFYQAGIWLCSKSKVLKAKRVSDIVQFCEYNKNCLNPCIVFQSLCAQKKFAIHNYWILATKLSLVVTVIVAEREREIQSTEKVLGFECKTSEY